MKILQYDKHEKEFLEAKATEYQFSSKTRLVFVERFREKNAEQTNKAFAEEWESSLCEGTKQNSLPETILQDRLKVICTKIEEKGCDFKNAKKGKWKIAKQWLRETQYPQWLKHHQHIPLNLTQLWQNIVRRATPTQQMGPVLAGRLEMWSDYPTCIPLGSNICFEVKLERPGHLLLLEKATSGRLWCLCPSFLAPQPLLPSGVATLPQPGATQKSFKITGNPGLSRWA
ncbi:MAG: DUF4384 domain-containing protein [Cyanobacteriota bacterium]|nr:DUF4384 domain-containing protein [Cyanobacteriota bacterium]